MCLSPLCRPVSKLPVLPIALIHTPYGVANTFGHKPKKQVIYHLLFLGTLYIVPLYIKIVFCVYFLWIVVTTLVVRIREFGRLGSLLTGTAELADTH